MAGLLTLPRGYYTVKFLISVELSTILRCMCNDKTVSLEPDALDDFTTKLLQKKTLKWENQKSKQKKIVNELSCIKIAREKVQREKVNPANINELIVRSIEECDDRKLMELARECIKQKFCPEITNMYSILNKCSQFGYKDYITEFQQLYTEVQPDTLLSNSNFTHFLAQAVWIKGNIHKSLELFEKVFRDNPYLRRRIKLMLKYLIFNVITTHSEAVLVSIKVFGEKLYAEYGDPQVLVWLWRVCFLSEWYSDQCIALDLLEKHDGLCRAITSQIPYVVIVTLKNHQVDNVYRLLEILLKYKLEIVIPTVVIPLFDYQIYQCNIQACNEIIEWSLKHDIQIPSLLNDKLLKLLHQDTKNSSFKQNIVKPTYSLKF